MKQGWEIKKLGEIGKVSMCKRIFKEDTTPEGDIPFYKIGTFGKTPDAFISKERYNEFRSKFSFPKKGDILISASGTIGRRVRYDGQPAYFQDSNIVWIDNNEKLVLNDYLYRFYEICNWGASKGATISRLYNDNLKQIEIPFPKSIQEQHRIVSILDEAFATIEKAKANAEQNLKNAKELFESYLKGVFENKGDNWAEKTLKEVCAKITDGTHQTPKYFDDGIIFLSSKNVTSGKIDWENIKYIDAKQHIEMHKRVAPRIGDILLAKNGTTGVAAMVDRDVVFDIYVSLAHIRVLDEIIPDFMLYFINSPIAKKQFNKRLKGSGVPNLHLEEIREVIIPFPKSKEAQQTIVRQLDALRAETQKLEAVYQKKIADLEELKKSILQKAFAGELRTEKALAI
ncbi:MAG: restriction endonuclease subunit S [Bacteroidetes bacterium]|uniref:restriction endonuclease subunit S n=1 Tax=Phnomibacter sp. TaxID=2836217 RepID=UPI002FDE3D63|nr:restriction endonuclease subunit S [Bacteroidota bacterium]